MTRKLYLTFLVVCTITVATAAANPYFGKLPAGTVKTFSVLNQEGLQEYYFTETMYANSDGIRFSIISESYENDDSPSPGGKTRDNYTIREGKTFTIIPPDSYGNGIRGKYIKGDLPNYPQVFSEGEKLEPYSATISLPSYNGINFIEGTYTCTDRKVRTWQKINVNGTVHPCFSIQEKHVIKMDSKGMEVPDSITVTWISEEVGVVLKQEYYDDGTLASTIILRSVEQPAAQE